MLKWFKLWPVVLCMALIFWLSVIKPPRLEDSGNWLLDNIDKPGHLLAYGCLAWLSGWSAYKIRAGEPLGGTQLSLIALLTFSYGLFLEIVQFYLPHRSFDYWDMLANASGVLLGLLIFVQLSMRRDSLPNS